MANIDRVSLPQNFFDITSPKLLVQPEPQYLYAQMWLASMAQEMGMVELPDEPTVGLPGRSVDGNGAPYAPAERDRLLLAEPLMTDVVAAQVDFDGLPGSMVRFSRPSYANTTYTVASRRIGANASISTQAINVGSEQVSLTLERFAGPYDQTNSRVAPFAIDAMDARLGVHKLSTMVGSHLKRDFVKFIDAVQVTLLDTASTVVYPDGMTADNDATTAGSFPLDLDTMASAERRADEANLPQFADGHRIAVLHPKQVEELRTDDDYQRSAQFMPHLNALMPGYVSTIGKLHVFKSTTLATNTNASTVTVRKGHIIAPGVLMGGMGRRPRVAATTDDNYGEAAKVIWLADLAFGCANNSLVIGLRSA